MYTAKGELLSLLITLNEIEKLSKYDKYFSNGFGKIIYYFIYLYQQCFFFQPYLGGIGLFNIVLALLSSYGIHLYIYTHIYIFFLFQIVTIWFYYLGICSTIGLVFTPAHPLIPFLLLGIGIDDMFVIVQCLSNVEDSDPTFKDKSIDLLVGETLKHAGVAITITSFTDFAVLIVGTITVSRIRFVKNHLPSYILPT